MSDGPGIGEGVPKGITKRNLLKAFLGLVVGGGVVASTTSCAPTPGASIISEPAVTPIHPTEVPPILEPNEERRKTLLNEIWGRLRQIEKNSQYKFNDLSLEENRTLYWQIETEKKVGMNVRALPETSSPNVGTIDERGIIRAQYILSLKTTGPDGKTSEDRWLILEKTDSEGNPQEGDPTQEVYPLKESDPMHIIPGRGGLIKNQIDGQGFLFVCINEGSETYSKPWNNTGANLRREASVRP